MFFSADVERHVEIAYAGFEPLYTRQMPTIPKESVHLVLVENMLEPPYQQGRHQPSPIAHFAFQYAIYVYGFLHNGFLIKRY